MFSTDKALTQEDTRKGKKTIVAPLGKKNAFEDEDGSSDEGDFSSEIPKFYLHDVLMRKVAGTMILEQQRLAIKRAALMQRAVSKKLPRRMKRKRARDAK